MEPRKKKVPKHKQVSFPPNFYRDHVTNRGLTATEFMLEVKGMYTAGLNADEELILEVCEILKNNNVVGVNAFRLEFANTNGIDLKNKFDARAKDILFKQEVRKGDING